VLRRLLDSSHSQEVRRQVPRLTLARLTGTATYRYAVPFLAVIGRGLGVPLHTMGAAAGAGDFTGLVAPLVGRRIDRASRQQMMTLGLAVIAAAGVLAAASTGAAMLAAAFVTLSVGKLFYDFAMGAWLADRVDYALRAEVVGVTELAWAGSMLLVVPVLGLVTAVTSWRYAYGCLALMNAAACFMIWRSLETDPKPHASDRRGHLQLDGNSVRAFAAFGFHMTAANCMFVVFGAWLTDAFGFSTVAIGATAIVLGLAELTATAVTIRYTDRIGKRRSLLAGSALMVPSALLLGTTGHQAAAGIALVTIFILGFEFGIVSALPLISALQPAAPASALGLAAGFGTVGRGVASIVSTRLYEHHGVGGSSLVAAGCSMAVMVLLGLGVREPAQALAR
jgi:predicted MFS family arabinose efflux permease